MKLNPIITGIIVVLVYMVINGAVHAQFYCAHPTQSGAQYAYRLSVVPFSREYTFDQPLRIPLVTPQTVDVPFAKFQVVVREFRENAGPRGPLDIGGALAQAYQRAAREPDKLKEFFSEAGRPLFDQHCQSDIERVMGTARLRYKTVEFLAPAEEGRAGGELVQACRIPTVGHRYVEARIFFQRSTRQVRRTRREAGDVVARFTLAATGTVDDSVNRVASFTFRLADGPRVTAENVPADVAPSVANASAARYKDRVDRQVQRIINTLNTERRAMEPEDQARLCGPNASGTTTKEIGFGFFRETRMVELTIQAERRRIVNENLATSCDRISCDCNNLEAGILTRSWQSTCRAQERGLIERCYRDGQAGRCHLEGPNPFYPQFPSPPGSVSIE